jgi:twitching motility protein PilT
MPIDPLFDHLLAHGLVGADDLHRAVQHADAAGGSLAAALLDLGLLDERGLAAAQASQAGVDFTDLTATPVDPRAAQHLTGADAARLRALPVAVRNGALVVAVAGAGSLEQADEVARLTGRPAIPVVAVPSALDGAIDRYLRATAGDPVPPGIAAAGPPDQAAPAAGAIPREALPPPGGAPAGGQAGGVALVEAPSGLQPSRGPARLRGQEPETRVSISELLEKVLELGASDLHLTSGARPALRVHGSLQQLEDYPVLVPNEVQAMVYAILTQKQRERLESELELDSAHNLPGQARFRLNVYFQRDSVGAAFRLIPFDIKPLEALGIPPQVGNLAHLPRGFVLVTGPTGSGKSTTLAALVDQANRERSEHIMTVEDPIEFLHTHKKCLVNQREVGEDTKSFANALKHVLRQDPDIILVGELRDLETISIALTAAETGHLVFATLHTQDAPQTIDRIIDVFPTNQQQQVRVQLAGSLQGVVCQQLLPTADGTGRVVATEVMMATPAIRNLIREGKTHQVYSAMQAGARHGMQTMDQYLAELVKRHRITYDLALERCHHVEDFNRLCGR